LYDPTLIPGVEEENARSIRIVAGIAFAITSASTLLVRSPRGLYNLSLTYTFLTNGIKGHQYWNEVQPGIVLGAIPLNKHKQDLLRKEKITGVLSLLEDYEMEPGIMYSPVQPADWKSAGVDTKWVRTLDFEPVTSAKLEEGADWIHQHLQGGPDRKVYVHCKAGRGRSTATVLVYMWKYFGIPVEDGWRMVKAKRPQINLNKRQMAAVQLATKKSKTA